MDVHGSGTHHTRDRQHATYLRDLAAGARLVVVYYCLGMGGCYSRGYSRSFWSLSLDWIDRGLILDHDLTMDDASPLVPVSIIPNARVKVPAVETVGCPVQLHVHHDTTLTLPCASQPSMVGAHQQKTAPIDHPSSPEGHPSQQHHQQRSFLVAFVVQPPFPPNAQLLSPFPALQSRQSMFDDKETRNARYTRLQTCILEHSI